ncbi:MFS transporter [Frankia sp. BMG5.23]|uniref:MFS transporter n=1 Tax=Frankia sp. BMG5.23 TaxID=683305 RepID=UPI001365469A|nr:MFS transporter [Frankia sp. BMG5.23]
MEVLMPEAGSNLLIRERLVLTVLLAVQFMLILDVSVVSVAMPDIQRGLRIGAGDLQWVATSYTLAFGGLLVAAGRFGDMFERRRMFILGTALFTISSLACGLTWQAWQLFIARGVQGVGAAIVSPVALSLLTTSFAEGQKRDRVLGLWGAVASGGAVVGQVAGGVITDFLGWRWVFLINLPVGICACVAAYLLLTRETGQREASLDIVGALTLTIGSVLAVLGISHMADHGADATTSGAFAAALVSLAAFAAQERRHGDPLIRFGVFRNPSLVGGNLLSIVNGVVVMTAIFFSTIYMQHVLGYSPVEAGLAFAPVTVVILLISSQTERLVAAYGVRTLLVAGALFNVAGMLGLLMMRIDGNYWSTVLPGLMLLGTGQGLAFAPATIAATRGVPDDEQGLASGLVTTSQQLGGAVGFAVLATVAAATLPDPATADNVALIHSFRIGYLAGLALPLLSVLVALILIPGRAPESKVAAEPIPPKPAEKSRKSHSNL